jgi:hypothetical protein
MISSIVIVVGGALGRAREELRRSRLFLKARFNLSQTSGQEVLLSVGTLLERIEAQSTNPEGRKAIELLGRREQAKQLLADLKRTDAPIIRTIDPDSLTEQERAIDKAWA